MLIVSRAQYVALPSPLLLVMFQRAFILFAEAAISRKFCVLFDLYMIWIKTYMELKYLENSKLHFLGQVQEVVWKILNFQFYDEFVHIAYNQG